MWHWKCEEFFFVEALLAVAYVRSDNVDDILALKVTNLAWSDALADRDHASLFDNLAGQILYYLTTLLHQLLAHATIEHKEWIAWGHNGIGLFLDNVSMHDFNQCLSLLNLLARSMSRDVEIWVNKAAYNSGVGPGYVIWEHDVIVALVVIAL